MFNRHPCSKNEAFNLGGFFLLFLIICSSCKTQETIKENTSERYDYPRIKPFDTIIEHKGYSLLYNEKHKQASWVSYVHTSQKLEGKVKRKNRFTMDPKVKRKSSKTSDYSNSGYDRGHLAPAADMSWSEEVMRESFYMSNVSPQLPSFNRGIWKSLENSVRIWCLEADSLFVVVGPILEDTLESIGENEVSVPNDFFKVILRFKYPSIQGIGFLMKNEKSKESIFSFAHSIDFIEEKTGLDFFYLFPDKVELQFEKEFDLRIWESLK